MTKKYKLKKSAIIIISLIIIFIVTLITLIIHLFIDTKSYSLEYNIGDYKINENYDSGLSLYYFEIVYNNTKYDFISDTEYQKSNKLISNITSYTDNEETCLIIESNYFNTNPLCSNEEENIDIHIASEKLKEELADYFQTNDSIEKNYNNYTIYNTDNNILIWSYKGFNYINKNEIEYIELFSKDIYDIPLATKINNYLVIPDYEQDYTFNKFYIINLNNYEVEEWNIKYDISFDSYILGINDKSIYLIDNKNKVEYEIVPHKQKMRIVSNSSQGIIYENGKEIKESLNKLTTETYSFVYENNYNYILKNNTLYLSYLDSSNLIKISNQTITSIVHINNDNIYYLVKDTLYKYNIKYGETKLITYSEWEFNYQNLIFIND